MLRIGSFGNRRTTLEMNDPTATDDPLAAVVAGSGPGSLRAWSLAVSFLGDCIVPRAGDVGIATIAEVLGRFGINAGVTRTSMSRLANDGWVKRQKVGRNSFYSLTPAALAESEAASRRIYAARHPQDPAPGGSISAAACRALNRLGCAQPYDTEAQRSSGRMSTFCQRQRSSAASSLPSR